MPGSDKEPPRRKKPAAGDYNPDTALVVMVTVCTRHRVPWLAVGNVHELLTDVWRNAAAWLTGRYVIMPDHIHLFASPNGREIDLERWVKYWKSQYSKRDSDPTHEWQSGQWDTRLRTGQRYSEKWEYVRNNPVRHGLVKVAEEWPYQGEIFELHWR